MNYLRFDGSLIAILDFPGGACQEDLNSNAVSILIGPNNGVLPRTVVRIATLAAIISERQQFG